MAKKASNISWFKLSNYDSVADFSSQEWLSAISNRVNALEVISAPDSSFFNDPTFEMRRAAYTYWEDVRKYGVERNHPKNDGKSLIDEALRAIRRYRVRKNTGNVGAIKNLTEWDAISHLFNTEENELIIKDVRDFEAINDRWWEAFVKGDSSVLRSREIIAGKYDRTLSSAYEDRHGYISVNLDASDAQIMKDIHGWLEFQRKTIARPTRLTPIISSDFEEWSRYKILPYFDLATLSALDGQRISNHSMGNVLFPDELNIDVTERIRKVTKIKSREVFCLEMQNLLQAQQAS